MAGTVKEMSLIKQVLQLKQCGESNRGIARQLPINKETVNGYMQTIEANGWKIEDLLLIDDPVLEGMFHAGSPAYTDERMKEFLRLLPYFREQLTNRKLHVTRLLLYDEYRQTHPDGYGKSQFYEHLKQNLVAQKALVEDAVRITYNRIAARLRGRDIVGLLALNKAVEEQNVMLNQTRMQKRPYTREERFHAMEKPQLKPLPEQVFEMRYYADLKVQNNCFVELRHEKITHFYSVPYAYIGRKAKVIFTRSWVKIYVDNQLVATHRRKHEYGHTYEPEHLASKSRAITERSAAYYITWAGKQSEDCKAYVTEIFNPRRTSNPEEVYYRICGAIISSYRKYEGHLVDLTCRQCLENRVFTYKKFEAILKNNYLHQADDEPSLFAPVPTDHANMRGNGYFK